ncbi:hypothetical protein EPO33_02490 [Patescibacteria group bacterium]|nr:MAG: hypothetical protein EPO33_02490 [Patescibacteria group bacterium]
MIFLSIATATVALVTALELADPGIFSTALPLPVAWAALLASWAIYGRHAGRGKPAPTPARIALTVVVALSTMPLVVFTVPTRTGAALAPLAALAVAAAVWALTDPRYADDPLQKTGPR